MTTPTAPVLKFHRPPPEIEASLADRRIALQTLIKDVDETIAQLMDALDQASKQRTHFVNQLAGVIAGSGGGSAGSPSPRRAA